MTFSVSVTDLRMFFGPTNIAAISDRDTISRVANALSADTGTLAMSISLMKLNYSKDSYERRENIKKSLMSFPTRFTGSLLE